MIGIYKIISPKNRIYIGQSVDIDRRFSSYKNINQNKSHKRLKLSFLKYGIDSHKFEIVEECDINVLNEKERYWQDYYDVLSVKGLNCKLTETCDKSGKLSNETKQKISLGNKGVKRNSIERRLQISNFMKTRPCSDETKLKISFSNKGKIISEEHKEILSIARKNEKFSNVGKKLGENKMSKKVICIETNKIWNSITECANDLNIPMKMLSKYLRGYRKNKTTIQYLH
jgi:group I intron endonuclease